MKPSAAAKNERKGAIVTRIINSDGPGRRRGRCLRAVAEVLKRLAAKEAVDGEVRDMASFIVFRLREIAGTVEESADAWDKRGYWKKAADFQTEWEWASRSALRLEAVIRTGAWEKLPEIMVELLPHFSGMGINRYTRSGADWDGCHGRLTGDGGGPGAPE